MLGLYLDTSSQLKIGVLSKEYKWLSYKHLVTNKSSEVVHKEIFEMLSALGKDIQDVTEVFVFAGPGSYTGIRVAEGVAQILKLENISVYSFNAFSTLELIKNEVDTRNLCWLFPAFKGEVYVRGAGEIKGTLVKESSFSKESGLLYITHGANKLSELCEKNSESIIHDTSHVLFPAVKRLNLRDEPYYYRSLDQEFTKSS